MKFISARSNAFVKDLRRLIHTPGAYRSGSVAWLEGDHLCRAYREKVGKPRTVVASRTGADRSGFGDLLTGLEDVVILDDNLFEQVSGLRSATGIGYMVTLPTDTPVEAGVPSIVLDRLQDPGNAGTILRSAAAFGFRQIVALVGTCALWSPKVLRAGMGAHFSLRLVENIAPQDLELGVPLIGTSSHAPEEIQEASLPWPCAWALGQEGQGLSEEMMHRCTRTVRIPQPGGEESLNVAAAATVCMYATAILRLPHGA